MLATLRTAGVLGVDAHLVQVEVDVSFGLPSFTVVGLPDASVRESRDRVRSAIRNCGFEFPPHRITVNLSPADVRKAGAAFDLPVALGVLAASGALQPRDRSDTLLLGELSLDGSIHATRGALVAAIAAHRAGVRHVLVPAANADEASAVAGIRVVPVETVSGAIVAWKDPDALAAHFPGQARQALVPGPDFGEVRGQVLARRALEIAAAGGHHVLLSGPPGSGKTMLARRLPGILPPLALEEALEATAIHSVAGTLRSGRLLEERPFRAPHHTISDVALVGGGSTPRPGEISLAHRGVLFLDELPEFDRRVLEVLRQPLEEGAVVIARAMRTVRFPARFQLVGAMNPCPCGYLGHARRICRCTPQQVARYASRISGPLRDRIDLTLVVPALDVEALHGPPAEASSTIRSRVCAARSRQLARGSLLNAELDGAAARRTVALDDEARRFLTTAASGLSMSARAHDRVLKVARTIADLEGADRVVVEHLAEAIQFRGGVDPR